MMSNTNNDWNDDERSTTINTHVTTMDMNNTNLGRLTKEILRDLDNQKFNVLWNEIEYRNYEFEQALDEEWFYGSSTENDSDDNTGTGLEEDQDSSLDALIKNKTMYS